MWPHGDSEMARLIREHDWSATRLGPVRNWPRALRNVVDAFLPSGFATIVLWGEELQQIYNDPCRDLIGDKHPAGLGQPTRICWPEVWHINGPIFARVLAGETVTLEDALFRVSRQGRLEDAWFTVSYSPLRDDGGVISGILVVVVETSQRICAELGMRRSEERFRALATAGSFILYRMSPDWKTMYHLSGRGVLVDKPEPDGNWAETYLLEEDRPTFFALIDQAIRSKSLLEMEHRVLRADGSLGWVLSRAVPMLDRHGKITDWFGIGTDVTAKHETAEHLRLSEEGYRAMLERQVRERTAELQASRDLLQGTIDSSDDMIQVFEAVRNETGEIVDFNWILNNHTSVSRYGEVRGESLLTRNPGVVPEGIFDAFKRVTETGVPEQAERHYVHEQFDGWFFQSVVKLGDGVATTTKNITEWKDAQAEILALQQEIAQNKLDESEKRFRQFAEASSDTLWIRNADTLDWEYLSPAFEQIYGVPVREALSGGGLANWMRLIFEADRQFSLESIKRVRDGAFVSFEFRIMRPDGELRWLRNTDFPMKDSTGKVVRIGGIDRDITEEKAAAEHVQVMVAELQHRTRNLIAVVRSIALQTLASSHSLDAFREEYVRRLDALGRVQGLLSRAADEPITLATLIGMELDALGAKREPNRLHLEGPAVRIRPSMVQTLALALHELATNARKYGALAAPDGMLSVTWRVYDDPKGARLALTWVEEGGLPPENGVQAHRGFGRELIERALPYSLQARTTFRHDAQGLRCTIDMPLDKPAG